MVGNSDERASRFSFANCCLVPSQMNLGFCAFRRSRFGDIQSARAPIAWCMVRAAFVAAVEGQCKYAGVSSAYSWLNIPHRKIGDYQYQKCRVDIVREPGRNLEEYQMERGPMGTGLFQIPRNWRAQPKKT